MTGEPATDAGAPATDAAASSAVEPAGGAAPAARASGGGAPAKPAEPAYTGPPQPPPRRPRVPMWAMPVLAALPFWALLYTGAFGERHTSEPGGIYAEGQALYTGQGCGGCHGPTGGGGVGPAMGGVTETFPEFADHVAWVKNGSAAVKGQPYGATGKIATGNMPGFDLTDAELIAVVCHERVTLGGQDPPPPECEEGADPDAAGADAQASEDKGAAGGDH